MFTVDVHRPGSLPDDPGRFSIHDTLRDARKQAVDEVQTNMKAHAQQHTTRDATCQRCREYHVAALALVRGADMVHTDGQIIVIETVPGY